MYTRTILVQNRTGLHARPATEFVNCASKFTSQITIKSLHEEDEVDAKSILFLLSLAIGQGDEVTISAKGDDEKEAVDALVALIKSKFDED